MVAGLPFPVGIDLADMVPVGPVEHMVDSLAAYFPVAHNCFADSLLAVVAAFADAVAKTQ